MSKVNSFESTSFECIVIPAAVQLAGGRSVSIISGIDVKNKVLLGTLGGVCLVGVLVMICGIGLSLGFHTLSVISFFSVIGLLIVLRLVGWTMKSTENPED